MNKKICSILIMSILTISILTHKAYGVQTDVRVKLPSFPVTLNGKLIENKNRQYPLIVYKDITYFPMTYYDSRFLGIESIWNEKTGLTVANTGVSWGYHEYMSNKTNYDTYSAVRAPFKISINGKNIDNTKEKYPLLLFRNITYFPLTWSLAAEEFGWDYSFDNTNGLNINSKKGRAVAGQITLPIITRENGEKGAFTMAGDYFYFEGNDGIIYQAPTENTSNKKKVYQLPKSDNGRTYVYAYLKTDNGKAVLCYNTDGTDPSSDNLILLKEDGTFQKLVPGYYGDSSSTSKIVDDKNIYFKESDGLLYRMPVSGGKAERLTEKPVGNYNVLNGIIFYSLKNSDNQLYIYGKEASLNPGGKLKSLEIQDGYMVAIFDKESSSQYKMMIIDNKGSVIYKTIENVLLVRIENGKIAYVKDN